MIAIALFDMHECGEKRSEVKRFKCVSSDKIDDDISKPSFKDEPRSPFVFFLYGNQNLPLLLLIFFPLFREDFRNSYDGNMVDFSKN